MIWKLKVWYQLVLLLVWYQSFVNIQVNVYKFDYYGATTL